MKIACVTTTIHVPRVLALYAKHSPEITFFIVGDRRTPDDDVVVFLQENVPNHVYYGIDAQYKLGYKCARLIPENCIQRRSIGFLEALKWGADVVVSIDDDNIPLNELYFHAFQSRLNHRNWSGLQASSESGWFDVGQLLQPRAEHRGFPHTQRAQPVFEPIVDAQIGVAAGICLGDPDIGAVERIANGPTVHGVSEVLRAGIVVDPRQTWTVFNSQNTAVIRDLVPAWFMLPHCGRYDDIFASLVVQHIMAAKGYCVHFGAPFVWQQRNQHDLGKDLLDEIYGMVHILQISEALDKAAWPLADTIEMIRVCYRETGLFSDAAQAWCDDVEKVI